MQLMMAAFYRRKHLRRLDKIKPKLRSIIYLVTICSLDRKPILTREDIFKTVTETLEEVAERKRWLVGRYVMMPDHIHFFCSPVTEDWGLSEFVRDFKSLSSTRLRKQGFEGKLWQREFFNHLLRSKESYASKWEYVRLNPVRKGLCESPEEWRFSGEVYPVEAK